MDPTDILALTSIVVFVANLADWSMVRRGSLMWIPSGRWRSLFTAWILVLAATSVAVMMAWLPPVWTPWVLAPVVILCQAVAIFERHAWPPVVGPR